MESILNYYYGIDPIKIEKVDDYYLVYADEDIFLFCEIINNIVEFEEIINKLNNTDIPYHLVVLSKDNSFYIVYDNKNYCLLKVRCELEDVNPLSFSSYNVIGNSNWADIWSKRIDYYEGQVNDLIKDESIKYALQYYIGLTEIGIAFDNHLRDIYKDVNYSFCHKRINVPLKAIDFYNPLNIIVDISVRDIAEYIKSAYFEETLTGYEILEMVDNIKFSEPLGNYFFLRLLYPSYFFYEYDNYVENKEVNNKIISYIKKSKDYESLLSKIYSRLKTYIDIKINLWFIKSQHL